MTEIVVTELLTVTREAGGRLVRFARTSVPIRSEEQIRSSTATIARALPTAARKGLSLLMDLRNAPMRNDPAFEAMMAPYLDQLFAGFDRRAALVRTAVGRLQVSRTSRDRGERATGVFDDEASAISYLLGRVKAG